MLAYAGPVTVPFVLSMGIGFGRAKRAQVCSRMLTYAHGFGVLTSASVARMLAYALT